jgi:putative transposase
VVVIDDLNVSGMLKNPHLAQAIGDVGCGEFRRQLTYKAAWYGCQVLVASRWEPLVASRWEASSKTCSGWVDDDLSRADRTYRCEQCGQALDRDLNAAINLANLAGSSPDRQNACGGDGAGLSLATQVKLAPMKHEPDTRYPSG